MTKSLKDILNLLKPYLRKELLGLFFTILYAIGSFLSPLASKYLIDNVIQVKNITNLYFGIMVFFVISFIQPIVGFFKDVIFLNISENITYDIRNDVFNSVLNSPIDFFSKNKKGEIVSRIINDCQILGEFITNFLVVYIKNILSIIVILIGMFYLSPKITGVTIIFLIFASLLIVLMGKVFRRLSLIRQKNYDKLCVKVNQMIDLIETIKSFVIEKKIKDNFQDINKKNKKDNIKIQKIHIIINNLINSVVIIVLCFIYGFGTIEVSKNNLTIGTVVALGVYFQMIIQPIFEVINNHISLEKIVPVLNRINEFTNIKLEDFENDINHKVVIYNDIDIQDVSFSYNDSWNLEYINMHIQKGNLIGILGQAGSGKSTLVNIILGFYEPKKGTILLDGISTNDLGKHSVRQAIGYVPQNIQLFNDSIRENIRCYNDKIDDEDIMQVCKKTGIHEFIMSLDKGYDTIINEKINISGGQKQMIAISRALAKDPSILIFDEPTSALDPKNEKEITSLISSLRGKYTLIIITHNISTVYNADNIFVLDKGKVLENGTHDELISKNGMYKKMFQYSKKLKGEKRNEAISKAT
ncbi:ABC-type multidrug transport system, ATPase and permease component [Gottschalkia purinilytica]|uniref:ABC-type multidrug transport system, ATPase and permease component n=1 Tax=Gottschalkia purinilytica TaxID=1503 RepID=A0A0L0W8F7_GOTPU|nr:ABC transporter ATP-binding protein [Gottschalkia purinilytica]KNF07555.1 ABC-type multidrug transport system, ATPase and permease component [Gottschalkia purinilytica]